MALVIRLHLIVVVGQQTLGISIRSEVELLVRSTCNVQKMSFVAKILARSSKPSNMQTYVLPLQFGVNERFLEYCGLLF